MHRPVPVKEKRQVRHLEEAEQVALFEWRDLNVRRYPGLDLMFAIPNGAFLHGDRGRRAMQWRRLRRAGAKSGVHDILLPVPRHKKNGLWIELKSDKGELSDEQVDWGRQMIEQGFAVAVCWGAAQAIDVVIRYWKGAEFETVNYLPFSVC